MDQLLVDHLVAPSTRVVATAAQLRDAVQSRGPLRVQTVNLHHIELAHSSAEFRQAILDADVITADGWPVVRAMRALGRPVERVTGSELTAALTSPTELRSVRRVGLLGASEEVGALFTARLEAAGRTVAFSEHGRHETWVPTVLHEAAAAAQLDLLLVAVTPPAGDLVAAELTRLGLGAPVVAVGGSVDMLCGVTRRAPALLRALGAEWLYRFAQEPRRLFRRYFIGGMGTFATQLLPVMLRLQHPTDGGHRT